MSKQTEATDMELLPCPFCGGKASSVHNQAIGEHVICDCGIQTDGYGVPKDAIEDWNTRAGYKAGQSELSAEVERLKKQLADTVLYYATKEAADCLRRKNG